MSEIQTKTQADVGGILQQAGFDPSAWIALIQMLIEAFGNCNQDEPEVMARSLQHPVMFTQFRIRRAVNRFTSSAGGGWRKQSQLTHDLLDYFASQSLTDLTAGIVEARTQAAVRGWKPDSE